MDHLWEELERREIIERVQRDFGITLHVGENADVQGLRDFEAAMGAQKRVASRDGRPVFFAAFPMHARRVE